MNVTITTLMENSVFLGFKGLTAEHGLSFLIETDDTRLLFDTGQTGAFLDNAKLLNIDVTDVGIVALSHGHYDHTGGLDRLSSSGAGFRLFTHPDAFHPKFARLDENSADDGFRDIGCPISRETLESRNVTVVETRGVTAVAPGIWCTGEVPFTTDFEHPEPDFFMERDGRRVPDDFPDDQSLFLETERGIVVVLGCAHRGVANILAHVSKVTGERKIHAILGGLHLGTASPDKLARIVAELDSYGVKRIGVGHCTGWRSTAALSRHLLDRMFPIPVRTVTRF